MYPQNVTGKFEINSYVKVNLGSLTGGNVSQMGTKWKMKPSLEWENWSNIALKKRQMMREGICRSTAQNKEASSQRAIYTRPGYSVKSVVIVSVITYVIIRYFERRFKFCMIHAGISWDFSNHKDYNIWYTGKPSNDLSHFKWNIEQHYNMNRVIGKKFIVKSNVI